MSREPAYAPRVVSFYTLGEIGGAFGESRDLRARAPPGPSVRRLERSFRGSRRRRAGTLSMKRRRFFEEARGTVDIVVYENYMGRRERERERGEARVIYEEHRLDRPVAHWSLLWRHFFFRTRRSRASLDPFVDHRIVGSRADFFSFL